MRARGINFQQILLGAALVAALVWNLAHAAEIRGVQLGSGPTGTRAELKLDGQAEYRLITLANPHRLVVDLPGSRLAGRPAMPAAAGVVQAVRSTRALIETAGIPVPLVTGAGTGTFIHEAASGVYGELQPGSFLFMDADYAANERDPAAPVFEHALFVKTQVISVCATHAVCDAGHKSHAIDSGLPRMWNSTLAYGNGGDEHGILRGPVLPALGDTLWLVPGHCDPTVNLYNRLVGVRGGLQNGMVERLIRVDARGALT